MFSFHLSVVVVVTATLLHSATAFQPGSDYNVYPAHSLYNCTGTTPISNVTVSNAIDSLPQVDPSSETGWEQWSLFLHGTPPVFLRWNKGNPSSTENWPSHFDLLVNINGTAIQATAEGDLTYTNSGNVMQIKIADNLLTWDPNSQWYNVSLNIDGYKLQMNSLVATMDAFHPNLGFNNGLLDQTGRWFGSVPLIRGQVDGSLLTPAGQNISVGGLTVMRHMFSEKPLPSYINKYSAGTIYGYSTEFYDTHIFYLSETTNGTDHTFAFLGRALPIPNVRGGFSSAWATYAVTDDPLYNLTIDATKEQINASFSGCANTNNTPYLFNITSWSLIGELIDLAGGTTTYYNLLNGSTTAAFEGNSTSGAIGGILEVYKSPTTVGSSP